MPRAHSALMLSEHGRNLFSTYNLPAKFRPVTNWAVGKEGSQRVLFQGSLTRNNALASLGGWSRKHSRAGRRSCSSTGSSGATTPNLAARARASSHHTPLGTPRGPRTPSRTPLGTPHVTPHGTPPLGAARLNPHGSLPQHILPGSISHAVPHSSGAQSSAVGIMNEMVAPRPRKRGSIRLKPAQAYQSQPRGRGGEALPRMYNVVHTSDTMPADGDVLAALGGWRRGRKSIAGEIEVDRPITPQVLRRMRARLDSRGCSVAPRQHLHGFSSTL